MPDTPRPAKDASPLGHVERHTPGQANTSLVLPRELIDASYPIPAGPVPLEGLRDYVTEPDTPRADRDRVWRWIVQQVRNEGGLWYAVMIYLAVPGLRKRAWKMTPVPPHSLADVDDTHAALIRQMTVKVHTVNLDRAIVARLIGQAAYEVGKEHHNQRQATTSGDDVIEHALSGAGRPIRYPPTPGNPDVVLTSLVRNNDDEDDEEPDPRPLDYTDAELIGRTYLETGPNGGARTLVDVAPELKLGESAARMRRDRAITRMARYLDACTRHGQPLTATDARAPDRAENLARADLDYLAEREHRKAS